MSALLRPWTRFLPVFLALIATALFLQARERTEILPPHAELSTFPLQVGTWYGENLRLTPGELEVLGPGQFLYRDYVSIANDPLVDLFVAYFPSQRSGDTIHSPKNCLPGSGWAPVESGRLSIQKDDGTAISVNRYVVAKGISRSLVLYWYQSHGRVTASEYWAKIFLVTGAIHLNRTDGALVRIVVPIQGKTTESDAQLTAVRFIKQILPTLDSYIPR